jgi:hypothetical protein
MNAPARIVELERQLHWAQLKIQALEEELRQRRIQQLGPRSETAGAAAGTQATSGPQAFAGHTAARDGSDSIRSLRLRGVRW